MGGRVNPYWRDAEWLRKAFRSDPESVANIVGYVHHRQCQCCGAPEEHTDAMDCGHRRCELCETRQHVCLACALAV
jgi:hypothetical protein